MWQMQIYQDRKDFHEWNLTNLKFYLVILVEQAMNHSLIFGQSCSILSRRKIFLNSRK